MNIKNLIIDLIVGTVVFCLGAYGEHKHNERLAIKAGVAYYAVDKDGSPQFKFITE